MCLLGPHSSETRAGDGRLSNCPQAEVHSVCGHMTSITWAGFELSGQNDKCHWPTAVSKRATTCGSSIRTRRTSEEAFRLTRIQPHKPPQWLSDRGWGAHIQVEAMEREDRGLRRLKSFFPNHPRFVLLIGVILGALSVILSTGPVFYESNPIPSTWSGFLQYNETTQSSVPTGRIVSSFFQITKDDNTPYDQNLSGNSWSAESAFLSSYGLTSGLDIVARDEGNYSVSPLRLNTSLVTIFWARPSDIGYIYIHRSNFAITASSFFSQMIARVGPGSVYPGLYFLELQIDAASPNSAFSVVFHYTSATPGSMLEIHARDISLSTGNMTRVNLTGNAVVELTSFSQAYFGLTGFRQTLFVPLGVRVSFQTPTVEMGNASGYLVDQAGKSVSPKSANLDFGQPYTFELDALYPPNGMGPIMTVAVLAVGATLVVTQDGVASSPERVITEDPVVQYPRLGAVGALAFFSGLLAGGGSKLSRPKVASGERGRPEARPERDTEDHSEASADLATVPVSNSRPQTEPNLAILLKEAGEIMRFQDARFWRSGEFYAGAVLTSLGAASAAFGLTSAITVAAFPLALIGVLFASLGIIALDLEAYNCLRNREVWKRLLLVQAGVKGNAKSIDLAARMLTTTLGDLENAEEIPISELVELHRSGMLPDLDAIRSSASVFGPFREILLVLGLVAAALASVFLLLTNVRDSPTVFNLITWTIATLSAPALIALALIPGEVQRRRLRALHDKADAYALKNREPSGPAS